MVCQCEVKRVARVVKASCLLMSRPAEWMRTQMGFLSGGLFFWPSLPVFGETWKPQLEWTGILLNEERLRVFTQQGLNRMWETGSESCVWGWGGLWRWGQYNVNGLMLSPIALSFWLWEWKHVFWYWTYWPCACVSRACGRLIWNGGLYYSCLMQLRRVRALPSEAP